MSNVLVTGGAGYIGSHTVKLLLRGGHNVTVLDTLELGHDAVFQYLPGAKLVRGNVGDSALVAKTLKENDISAVIHFAAYASVPESVADPEKYYVNNIVDGISLINSIKDAGVKHVIFSSSAATFGEPVYTPIDEKHPQKPTNPYGQTKLDFEHILHWYDVAYGIKSISLRYFCAAGADPEGELGRGSYTGDAYDSADAADRARAQAGDQDVRDGLPHPGRHRSARLYPCDGFGRSAYPGAQGAGGRRGDDTVQFRQR